VSDWSVLLVFACFARLLCSSTPIGFFFMRRADHFLKLIEWSLIFVESFMDPWFAEHYVPEFDPPLWFTFQTVFPQFSNKFERLMFRGRCSSERVWTILMDTLYARGRAWFQLSQSRFYGLMLETMNEMPTYIHNSHII